MKSTSIDTIPFDPDIDQLASELKIKPGSSYAADLEQLVGEARKIARPKAMFTISSVEPDNQVGVLLDGIAFQSRILCTNLNGLHRAFPYLATCGIELHDWAHAIDDPLKGYFADAITGHALRNAIENLFSQIIHQFGLGKTATMNPGSLEDWPLQAQIPLFSLLDDPEGCIGIYLTEHLLMVPRQSVSGILFETEKGFINCQLCPREHCTHRSAPFDPAAVAQYLP